MAARLGGLVCRARRRGIVVVVRLTLLILLQLGDDILYVRAAGFQLHGEQEELALVDLFALLPEAPLQELFENVLHALEPALVGVQLRGQIDHHLPQHLGVVGQVVEVDLHYNDDTLCGR